jgi:hypothetical protein
MRPLLAAALVVGLWVAIADGEDDPPGTDPTLPPENDYRLAQLTDARTQKIGILTNYANKGGGYTFMRGKQLVFYSLPYEPTTYRVPYMATVQWKDKNGKILIGRAQKWRRVSIIGTREMPLGGQTVYRSEMTEKPDGRGLPRRVDTPIAKWNRDTPNGKFGLSILSEDHETQLKLKSIIPVLEHASKP